MAISRKASRGLSLSVALILTSVIASTDPNLPPESTKIESIAKKVEKGLTSVHQVSIQDHVPRLLSIGESITSTESSPITTPMSWMIQTPIPSEWLHPNSKFNEFGILKVQDSTKTLLEIKPQEGLSKFLDEASNQPKQDYIKFMEMGLNSDNPAIFYFAIQKIRKSNHYPAVPILSNLLKQEDIHPEKHSIMYRAFHQLTYDSLPNDEKAPYLQNLLIKEDPKTRFQLLEWAIFEFGEVAGEEYSNALISLDNDPLFETQIRHTRIKMKLNTKYPKSIERYINASIIDEPQIRDWALKHLQKIDALKAARYLLLLYEQNNIDHGQLEFEKIREALEMHQSKFPHLYLKLLPKFSDTQNTVTTTISN